MRSDTESSARQAIPVRIRARRRRVLNLGRLNRSIALVVLGLAAVVVIALMPVDDVNARHDGAASAPQIGRRILHFPDERFHHPN